MRSPGLYGRTWVLVRNERTDDCGLCGPLNISVKRQARRRARDPIGEWLLGAPRFTDDLLAQARAAYQRPQRTTGDTTWSLVPWADTLDLRPAADWLYELTRGGKHSDYPPASDDRCAALSEHLHRRGPVGRELDIGTVFKERGFPYPPGGFAYDDGDGPPTPLVRPGTGLIDLPDEPTVFGDLNQLPAGYADVLTFTLEVRYPPSWDRRPEYGHAAGSLFTDDEGRVMMLWR